MVTHYVFPLNTTPSRMLAGGNRIFIASSLQETSLTAVKFEANLYRINLPLFIVLFYLTNFKVNLKTVITQRISEAVENKYITRTITLDISAIFDKVWRWECRFSAQDLQQWNHCKRLLIYDVLLAGRSMKAVVNCKSSDAHVIMAENMV